MTDRGFHESCGSAASQAADPAGLRRRLRAPDRHPLRGPRRAGVRRHARRRGPDRPAADRRDRRLLRRRHVDGAGRAPRPQDAARRQPRPVDEPRTAAMQIAAAAPTSPGPTSPTRWPRTAAPSTTSPTRPTRAAIGVEKQSLSTASTSPASARPASTRPAGTRPDRRPDRLEDPARRGRALRRPEVAGDPRRDHAATTPPTTSTTRSPPAPMLISSGFTDDLFPADEAIRYYNRTRTAVPGRRPRAVLRRLRPPARRRTRPTSPRALTRARERLVRLLRQGRGRGAARGRRRPTPRPARTRAPSGGPYTPSNWAQIAPGEIRFDSDDGEDDRPGAGSDDDRGDLQPGRRRRRLRAPPTAPTSPAPPPTGSTRPRPAATRCSARRP